MSDGMAYPSWKAYYTDQELIRKDVQRMFATAGGDKCVFSYAPERMRYYAMELLIQARKPENHGWAYTVHDDRILLQRVETLNIP